MRLICPNCGAQYEVPDDIIPAEGRDVQCSNCGNTWLETPGGSAAAEAFDAGETVSVADAVQNTSAAVAQEASGLSGSIQDAFADIDPDEPPLDMPDTVSDFESAEGETPPTTAPQRRPVDSSVASILQEEAARETAARQADMGDALESQTDLGLDDIDATAQNHADETRRMVESMKGDAADETQAAVASTVAAAGSRRELLPDIEEINSSLRSNSERGEATIDEPEVVAAEKRRGFRFGFLITLLVIAILVALYIFAPQIAETVPALAAPLESYVAGVDTARIWLDVKSKELLEMIKPAVEATPEPAATDG